MKLGNWTRVAVIFCLCNSVCAAEVYTWKDQNGITHFSQIPPESGNSEMINVEDASPPGSSEAYAESEVTDPAAAADSDDLFTESGDEIAQQRLEQLASDRKDRQEAQAETAELCKKNEELLARLEPARRVIYVNDEGEQVRLDNPQRMGLIEETKDFIDKNCK